MKELPLLMAITPTSASVEDAVVTQVDFNLISLYFWCIPCKNSMDLFFIFIRGNNNDTDTG